jgi:hypothetical protein
VQILEQEILEIMHIQLKKQEWRACMGKLSIVFVRPKEADYFFSAGVSAAGA